MIAIKASVACIHVYTYTYNCSTRRSAFGAGSASLIANGKCSKKSPKLILETALKYLTNNTYLAATGVVRTAASILITLLAVAPSSSLYCVALHCVPPGCHCLLVFSSGLGHTPHSPYTFNGSRALKKLHPGGKEVRTTFGAVTFIGQVLPFQLKTPLILHCSFQWKKIVHVFNVVSFWNCDVSIKETSPATFGAVTLSASSFYISIIILNILNILNILIIFIILNIFMIRLAQLLSYRTGRPWQKLSSRLNLRCSLQAGLQVPIWKYCMAMEIFN